MIQIGYMKSQCKRLNCPARISIVINDLYGERLQFLQQRISESIIYQTVFSSNKNSWLKCPCRDPLKSYNFSKLQSCGTNFPEPLSLYQKDLQAEPPRIEIFNLQSKNVKKMELLRALIRPHVFRFFLRNIIVILLRFSHGYQRIMHKLNF